MTSRDFDELRRRYDAAHERALRHLWETAALLPGELKMSQADIAAVMGKSKSSWDNYFKEDEHANRRGASYAQVQALVFTFDLPKNRFQVDWGPLNERLRRGQL